MKLCKDCRHINEQDLNTWSRKFEGVALSEDGIRCNRDNATVLHHTSVVTGKTTSTASYAYCSYERTLGSCKDAKFFEPKI